MTLTAAGVGGLLFVLILALGAVFGLLILVGIIYIHYLFFKFLCTIHARIVADEIDKVLEARGVGFYEE